MGTDTGVTPHGRNLRELELMVAGGMTPWAAYVATTRTAAELMGLDGELGTVEVGKRADLVVVTGDPADVGACRRGSRRSTSTGFASPPDLEAPRRDRYARTGRMVSGVSGTSGSGRGTRRAPRGRPAR